MIELGRAGGEFIPKKPEISLVFSTLRSVDDRGSLFISSLGWQTVHEDRIGAGLFHEVLSHAKRFEELKPFFVFFGWNMVTHPRIRIHRVRIGHSRPGIMHNGDTSPTLLSKRSCLIKNFRQRLKGLVSRTANRHLHAHF